MDGLDSNEKTRKKLLIKTKNSKVLYLYIA